MFLSVSLVRRIIFPSEFYHTSVLYSSFINIFIIFPFSIDYILQIILFSLNWLYETERLSYNSKSIGLYMLCICTAYRPVLKKS